MSKNCLLIGVNSKYIHTNLAIRYLKAYAMKNSLELRLKEFSINDHLDNILKEVYNTDIDVYGFSCYIWNIDVVLKLCSSLKKLNPQAVLLLGGPEVSFDAKELLLAHPFIDFIIRGEGELTFTQLLHALNRGDGSPSDILGLTYRSEAGIISNPDQPLLQCLDDIPFPYEGLEQLENKIIYYETSRGCPFNCQYCLSSTLHGVRFFSMDRIKTEIKFFVEQGVKQVKLVDRTFNCNKRHSLEIIRYIIQLGSAVNFHFEIGADLLDDEMIRTLATAPKDMFQFEIGVQSTNARALNEVSRAMNLEKLKANVLALQKAVNSHMHLDLIAGLPYEDYESFGKSFDEVHQLLPDMLQLGFLKLLKGSGIRERAEMYGIQFNSFNPYEVLKTKWISYEELMRLKDIEQLLELYYNSGRFRNSLQYLFAEHYPSYFSFYGEFAGYWKEKGLFTASQSTKELYNILYGFAAEKGMMGIVLNELIKLDWLLYFNNGMMPSLIQRDDHSKLKNPLHDFIKTSEALKSKLQLEPSLDGKSLLKLVYYEVFLSNVLENRQQENYVIFFTKKSAGEVLTYSCKLSDIPQ